MNSLKLFWKSFSKKSVLRQLYFVLALFALLIPIAFWDSATQIEVSFDTQNVYIKSDEYSISIGYDEIESAELVPLAEPGLELENTVDNDIIRTGKWQNTSWGEYYINADLDATDCIVAHLKDGRVFVFSRKDNEATADDFETLQIYLAA